MFTFWSGRQLFQEFDDIAYTSEGLEHLEQALQKKSGGILLMSHMGNWEIAAHLLKREQQGLRLLLYMGVKHIRSIAERLIRYGRNKSESVAIIFKATTEDQKVVVTTLETAADDLDKSKLKPPALIVIGDVVKLRPELDWYGKFLALGAKG